MIAQGLGSRPMPYLQLQAACPAFAHVIVDKIGMKLDLFDILCSAFRKQDAIYVSLVVFFCFLGI